MSRARGMVLALVAAALAAGCYAPTVKDGQYLCDQSSACPEGFACSSCGVCVKHVATDGGGPPDCPGCAFGPRAQADAQLARLAFCPAAWKVPGTESAASQATPCKRSPAPDGTNGQGVDCSIEDSCAAGWHVCKSDDDVAAHGLDANGCAGADAFSGIWVTRQVAQGLAANGMCVATGSGHLAGCGPMGNKLRSGCASLQRWYGGGITTGAADCASPMADAWVCVALQPESQTLYKKSLGRGGVLCCAD